MLDCCNVCAESRELLQLHLKDLGSRERAVHAQLAALNEDSGDDWQELDPQITGSRLLVSWRYAQQWVIRAWRCARAESMPMQGVGLARRLEGQIVPLEAGIGIQ